jgi:hypothetical protein
LPRRRARERHIARGRRGKIFTISLAVMRPRVRACLIACLVIVHGACSGTGRLFRQYEYEEDTYISLDGSATVYVNSSIPALNALRGTAFDARPGATVDRAAVRDYYSTPNTHVSRVSATVRRSRRFVHVRIDVDDIRRLGQAPPFAWSSYRFERDGGEFVYRQDLGAAADTDRGRAGWSGQEVVAFRLHLPSTITSHPAGAVVRRGNILVWEQPLADRLRGTPLTLDARMQTESILYRTLWLFGATFVAVAAVFALVIWWVMRRPVRGSHHADTV